jgi:hypothetical protein
MKIPLNYYHADDFPEIAAEQEGIEDVFVNARLEELHELYSSDSPSIRDLESIVHRLFRREFPIRKHPRLGYANSGETVREFALKRFAKFKKFVRSMTFQSRMDEHEVYTFCWELEKQIMSSQYVARRIIFFERNGETWWTVHESEKVKNAPSSAAALRPLLPYFHGSKELDLALKAATETGLISEAGKWVHNGYKTKAISVFWRAAVKAGVAKADAPIYKVIEAIKEQFSEHFGQNAIDKKKDIADFGDEYKELYERLCAIMRP